jgi:hypothetical protein
VSYLEMAKQAAARLRAARDGAPADDRNDMTTECPAWRPTYAHPWPDEVHGLGFRRIGPFDPCVGCGRGSWVRYGSVVLCCPCAIAKLSGEPEWQP